MQHLEIVGHLSSYRARDFSYDCLRVETKTLHLPSDQQKLMLLHVSLMCTYATDIEHIHHINGMKEYVNFVFSTCCSAAKWQKKKRNT